jgi:hypothetical protein
MNPWIEAFVAAVTPAAVLAVGAAFAASLWRHTLSRNIESFKHSLIDMASAESQRLRHALELAAMEHRVRFTGFHERRAEVIAELYTKLVEASWAMGYFVSPIDYQSDPPKEEKYVAAMNATAEAFRFFDRNRLFLSARAAALVDALTGDMRKTMNEFGVHVQLASQPLAAEFSNEKLQAWQKAHAFFEKDLPNLRMELEKELHRLLTAESSEVQGA